MTRLTGMQRKIGEGTLSLFNAASCSASVLLDHFGPKLQGKVFALGISKLKAKFFLITLREDFQVERDELSEVLYVVAIALDIAFEL